MFFFCYVGVQKELFLQIPVDGRELGCPNEVVQKELIPVEGGELSYHDKIVQVEKSG
jgi:hypothetical protein